MFFLTRHGTVIGRACLMRKTKDRCTEMNDMARFITRQFQMHKEKTMFGRRTSLIGLLLVCGWVCSVANAEVGPPGEAGKTAEAATNEIFEASDTSSVANTTITGETKRSTNGTWATAVQPKPLSARVKRGLDWLVQTQHKSGGWGQGEESQGMGRSLDKIKDVPNVADTSSATLAMLRSGSSPRNGAYRESIRRAIYFVCGEIENADYESLYVTKLRGTRLQAKLGTYIDTFLVAALLAEVRNTMPDEADRERVVSALDKVMNKIENNQRQDGSWGNKGWAPALAESLAGKAINRAAQAGADVDEKVRELAEKYARDRFDSKTYNFSTDGSANVDLYAAAAAVSGMQDSDNTNAMVQGGLRMTIQSAASGPDREQAQLALDRIEGNKQDLDEAKKSLVQRLEDNRFIAGFGSNGGEEFLSYMLIGESLVVDGGPEWEKWDASITDNLNRIQNNNGSWTGHHCITGRTFCTAAALLVLMVDRAPIPLAASIRKR